MSSLFCVLYWFCRVQRHHAVMCQVCPSLTNMFVIMGYDFTAMKPHAKIHLHTMCCQTSKVSYFSLFCIIVLVIFLGLYSLPSVFDVSEVKPFISIILRNPLYMSS